MVYAKFLSDNGYIKLSRFIWGKNISTDKVTGGMLLVNIFTGTMDKLQLMDHFLFVKYKPRLKFINIKYNSLLEFKRIVLSNEKIHNEFLEKRQKRAGAVK